MIDDHSMELMKTEIQKMHSKHVIISGNHGDNGVDLGYYSHFPILGAALVYSKHSYPLQPILELGLGWGSTPLIHYGACGRDVVSVDTSDEWMETFSKYSDARHSFVKVNEIQGAGTGITGWLEGWRKCDAIETRSWGLAFVDCWPGEVRVELISRLKGRCGLIVAHDIEADESGGGGNYGWRKLDKLFTYEYTMKRIRPWTRIYSDDIETVITLKCVDMQC